MEYKRCLGMRTIYFGLLPFLPLYNVKMKCQTYPKLLSKGRIEMRVDLSETEEIEERRRINIRVENSVTWADCRGF